MEIKNLASKLEDTYFDINFLNMIESHHSELKKTAKVETITDFESYKFEGDFYGILDLHNVPKRFHLIVLRFNGLSHSGDYDGISRIFIVPDFARIDMLRSIFTTSTAWQ